MTDPRKPIRSSFLIAALMLVSRVFGFLRDVNTAAVIGMSGSPVADAFFCAFRLPNLFRRLYEEGAFGLSWIPLFAGTHPSDRKKAWRLFAEFLRRGAFWALLSVAFGELLAAAALCALGSGDSADALFAVRTIRLTMIMLPYLFFMTLAAECAATLQALERFGVAAAMPLVFNLFWLAALFLISPFGVWLPMNLRSPFETLFGQNVAFFTAFDRTVFLSGVVVAASLAQFFIQRIWLGRIERREIGWAGREGNRSDFRVITAEEKRLVRTALRKILPTALGLLFVQINTLLATLAAALPATWFGGKFGVQAASGAASAIFFAERLYEFPLGLIGVATATAFFPILAQRVAAEDFKALSADFSLAVRSILLLAVPAGVGLLLLSGPLSEALYQRGDFSSADTARTATLIGIFAFGVPAFCLQPLLIRTFYAFGDVRRPILAGLVSTAVFVITAVILCVRFGAGETGLVEGIVGAAYFQTLALFYLLERHCSVTWDWSAGKTLLRACIASGVMAVALVGVDTLALRRFPDFWTEPGTAFALLRIAVALSVALPVYFGAVRLLGEHRLRPLFPKKQDSQ